MKVFKKVLAVFLSAVMLLALFPLSVFADHPAPVQEQKGTGANGTLTVTVNMSKLADLIQSSENSGSLSDLVKDLIDYEQDFLTTTEIMDFIDIEKLLKLLLGDNYEDLPQLLESLSGGDMRNLPDMIGESGLNTLFASADRAELSAFVAGVNGIENTLIVSALRDYLSTKAPSELVELFGANYNDFLSDLANAIASESLEKDDGGILTIDDLVDFSKITAADFAGEIQNNAATLSQMLADLLADEQAIPDCYEFDIGGIAANETLRAGIAELLKDNASRILTETGIAAAEQLGITDFENISASDMESLFGTPANYNAEKLFRGVFDLIRSNGLDLSDYMGVTVSDLLSDSNILPWFKARVTDYFQISEIVRILGESTHGVTYYLKDTFYSYASLILFAKDYADIGATIGKMLNDGCQLKDFVDIDALLGLNIDYAVLFNLFDVAELINQLRDYLAEIFNALTGEQRKHAIIYLFSAVLNQVQTVSVEGYTVAANDGSVLALDVDALIAAAWEVLPKLDELASDEFNGTLSSFNAKINYKNADGTTTVDKDITVVIRAENKIETIRRVASLLDRYVSVEMESGNRFRVELSTPAELALFCRKVIEYAGDNAATLNLRRKLLSMNEWSVTDLPDAFADLPLSEIVAALNDAEIDALYAKISDFTELYTRISTYYAKFSALLDDLSDPTYEPTGAYAQLLRSLISADTASSLRDHSLADLYRGGSLFSASADQIEISLDSASSALIRLLKRRFTIDGDMEAALLGFLPSGTVDLGASVRFTFTDLYRVTYCDSDGTTELLSAFLPKGVAPKSVTVPATEGKNLLDWVDAPANGNVVTAISGDAVLYPSYYVPTDFSAYYRVPDGTLFENRADAAAWIASHPGSAPTGYLYARDPNGNLMFMNEDLDPDVLQTNVYRTPVLTPVVYSVFFRPGHGLPDIPAAFTILDIESGTFQAPALPEIPGYTAIGWAAYDLNAIIAGTSGNTVAGLYDVRSYTVIYANGSVASVAPGTEINALTGYAVPEGYEINYIACLFEDGYAIPVSGTAFLMPAENIRIVITVRPVTSTVVIGGITVRAAIGESIPFELRLKADEVLVEAPADARLLSVETAEDGSRVLLYAVDVTETEPNLSYRIEKQQSAPRRMDEGETANDNVRRSVSPDTTFLSATYSFPVYENQGPRAASLLWLWVLLMIVLIVAIVATLYLLIVRKHLGPNVFTRVILAIVTAFFTACLGVYSLFTGALFKKK